MEVRVMFCNEWVFSSNLWVLPNMRLISNYINMRIYIPISHLTDYFREAYLILHKMADLSEREVFAKTVYAEARGEPVEGQRWVAWVIKNRAYLTGKSIKTICLEPYQFECWNGKNDIIINEEGIYQQILALTDSIRSASQSKDPTGGATHYNNPTKEGYPEWTTRCIKLRKIGNHQFYKDPNYGQ